MSCPTCKGKYFELEKAGLNTLWFRCKECSMIIGLPRNKSDEGK